MTESGTADGPAPEALPPDLQALQTLRRIAAVERLVAQGPVGERVEELTALAARVLRTPYSQVSLLGATEQVVAAVHGLDLRVEDRRGPLEHSLCTVTAASGEPFVVEDARSHPWVSMLPPVTAGLVGSYLGVVLTDRDGEVLGSLCVYDGAPRRWRDEDVADLTALGEAVAAELDRTTRAVADAGAAVRLQLVAAAADLGSYEYDLRTGALVWDERMLSLHGLTSATFTQTIDSYDAVVHPEDRTAVAQAMAHAVSVVGDLVVDYRVVLPDGSHRWVKARGRVLPDMLGAPTRILGAAYDSSGERGLRDELTRLMETMPAAFLRCDRDWCLTYVNAVAEGIFGQTRQELVGLDLWEAFPEAVGGPFESAYRQAMADGTPGIVAAYFAPLARHFEVHVWPDDQGLSLFFHDITDRTHAQHEVEQASARLAVLASGGAALSASLQPDEVLAVLADLVVPELAGSLVLAVTDGVAGLLGLASGNDPERVHPVHVRHADPALQPVLESVVAGLELRTAARAGVGRAIRTGQVHALPQVPDELLVERARTAEHLELSRRLNTGPSLTVPLRSPSAVLGALTVGASGDEPLDELLLADLAARAGIALDNALAFARHKEAATDLQRALLPREAPDVPEVEVATRYRPASSGALAGGDFFKTVRVEGRLVTVLGDVMGHGTESAARAGQLHALVGALALEGHLPGALLGRLAEGVHQMMDLELATLVICSYDPQTRRLTTASAGHPPPLFAPIAGEPYYLELEPGPPIGVASAVYPEHTCALEAGATTVLFSDGLVERRGESITTGLERLRAAVRELRLPPEAVADHVLRELGRERGFDDDVALLVLSHL